MTAATPSNVERARALLQAWREGGGANIAPLLADDVAFELPFAPSGIARRIEGKSAVMKALDGFFALFRKLRLNVHECYESPSTATVILECTSVGLPADDGAIYQNRYVFLVAFRGAEIARIREYSNPYPVMHLSAQTRGI
ncbi:MAG TPA: nuclear transport factor 2 family protein [Nevskiaceae bacterium]|nr:nuclear transport factor 2 family protein [Nevskiaceae bacterium]